MLLSVPPVLPPSRVLLTGATGFVGSALYPALVSVGYEVRCLTRDLDEALSDGGDRGWVEGDLDTVESLEPAMNGCEAAFYLVHGMGENSPDFREREQAEAQNFAGCASRAGLKRIIYLGGIQPDGQASEHLSSRLAVGRILRGGTVPALELRASMIIGAGSQSWQLVRDIAARLPIVALPASLKGETQPVAIDDVVAALAGGLRVPMEGSASYDLPGPETLSIQEILGRASECLGLERTAMVSVPLVSPDLAAQALLFITDVDGSVTKELLPGLTHDLLATTDVYWSLIVHADLQTFDEAARNALADEQPQETSRLGRILETAVEALRGQD